MEEESMAVTETIKMVDGALNKLININKEFCAAVELEVKTNGKASPEQVAEYRDRIELLFESLKDQLTSFFAANLRFTEQDVISELYKDVMPSDQSQASIKQWGSESAYSYLKSRMGEELETGALQVATDNLVTTYDLVVYLTKYFKDSTLFMEMRGEGASTHRVEEIIFQRGTDCALSGYKLEQLLDLFIHEVKSEVRDVHKGDVMKLGIKTLKACSVATNCQTILHGVSPLLHATVGRTAQQHQERALIGESYEQQVRKYEKEIKPFQEQINAALEAVDPEHGQCVQANTIKNACKMGSTLKSGQQKANEPKGNFTKKYANLSLIYDSALQSKIHQYASVKNVELNFRKGCHADALLESDKRLEILSKSFVRLIRELDKMASQPHNNHECDDEAKSDDEDGQDNMDVDALADEEEAIPKEKARLLPPPLEEAVEKALATALRTFGEDAVRGLLCELAGQIGVKFRNENIEISDIVRIIVHKMGVPPCVKLLTEMVCLKDCVEEDEEDEEGDEEASDMKTDGQDEEDDDDDDKEVAIVLTELGKRCREDNTSSDSKRARDDGYNA